jgi:lipopolysaccharide/colanic/teichoic acid biosynthesis glycosyltransferase
MIIRLDTRLRRLVDVVAAILMLLVLFPVFVVVAIAIRLDSAGPVFYPAVRVGCGNRPFRMLKFRSMRPGADLEGAGVSGHDDPRVTRVGQALRRTKLDELPQLLNVVQGTMTLVGPRAESPRYLPYYTTQESRLLTVRPGVTGPGQLEFTRRQAAELDATDDPDRYYVEHHLHDKLALDLEYLCRRGTRRDIAVVVTTAALVPSAAWAALAGFLSASEEMPGGVPSTAVARTPRS